MKNIIITITLLLFATILNAQSSSVSTTSSKTSISVSSNDNSYSYDAKFDNDKTREAKKIMVETLGKPSEETDRTSLWEGKGYSASLRQGKIEIEMDFDKVTKSFRLKVEDMGDQISEAVGAPKTPATPKPPKK